MKVNTVANAIAILRHLAVSRPRGVNAIARELALSPSSCFNILKTLVDEGVLDFEPDTKLYSISIVAMQIFNPSSSLAAWSEWLESELQKLASAFNVSAGLWQLQGRHVVLDRVAVSSQMTRVHLEPGQKLPRYLGAMGRCIAAHEGLPRAKVAQMLARLRWQNAPSLGDYIEDLTSARDNRWAIDNDNYISGIATVAAIVTAQSDRITHCLTATGFAGQHDADGLAAIGERIAQIAEVASQRLRVGSVPAA